MKRFCITVLLIATLFTALSAVQPASVADNVVIKTYDTLEQYKEQERMNPPLNGIYWNYFSVLGDYLPMSYPAIDYLYANGSRRYTVRIESPLEAYEYYRDLVQSDNENAAVQRYVSVWEEHKDQIDSYSVKQYIDVELAARGRTAVWLDLSESTEESLTALKGKKDADTAAHCLGGRLVYRFDEKGMNGISWMYEGYLYTLLVSDAEGQRVCFDSTDTETVQDLLRLDSCAQGLNTLMNRLSGNALAEMNKGTLVAQLDGADGGANAAGSMSTTWMIVWSVVAFLTLAGVIVIVVDITRGRKRR